MSLPRRPALGLRGLPAPDGGVLVTAIDAGTAAAAILRAGDRLLAIDDLPVDDPRMIAVQLRGRRSGDDVTLRFVRDGEPAEGRLTLAPLPEETCPEAHVHYDSIEVAGVRLRTITARPSAATGPVPAALLLPDLACASQDFALAPGQPAQAIVAALAAAGVASMRVERPGLGDSEGGPCEALGWRDEVAMFRAGLAALASDPAVDPDALCLFGHGVGGTLAPIVGAEERARRIVVFGTCARRWSACVRRSAGPADR
ncbi:MAG TPA: PDZ domain-containing protein, partial [Nannocystis sp.]